MYTSDDSRISISACNETRNVCATFRNDFSLLHIHILVAYLKSIHHYVKYIYYEPFFYLINIKR